MRGHLRDHGFEDVRVADLLRALQRTLRLEAVDDRLHGGVCGPALRGEGLLNLADRQGALGPEGLHDLELELAQPRRRHAISYTCRRIYDKAVGLARALGAERATTGPTPTEIIGPGATRKRQSSRIARVAAFGSAASTPQP